MDIKYVKGDITKPPKETGVIIAHVCNNIGAWGAGVSGAIGKAFPQAEQRYRKTFSDNIAVPTLNWLGSTIDVSITDYITVVNMIAQHKVKREKEDRPLRLWALNKCLVAVADLAIIQADQVHMPRIGCGLAGGKWEDVEPLIKLCLTDRGVPVTVYDLE